MSAQSLPTPLQEQIGAYLNKQLPAYCEIDARDMENDVPNVSIDKTNDSTDIIYRIFRHGIRKFNYEINGLYLRNIHINNVDRFVNAQIDKLNAANEIIVEIDEDDVPIFRIWLRKEGIIEVSACNGEIETIHMTFKTKHYKPAFDTMLKDLKARRRHLLGKDKE